MENNNKNIEELIDKLMSKDTLEQPSLDFTDKVMSKVEAISNSKATVYEPLISKKVWILILTGFIALVVYNVFNKPSATGSLLERFNISGLFVNPFQVLSFDFSAIMVYAFVLLAIMISIQVPLLKYYFNKRMTF